MNDDDTFICYQCGAVCFSDEGDGDMCDDCLDEIYDDVFDGWSE